MVTATPTKNDLIAMLVLGFLSFAGILTAYLLMSADAGASPPKLSSEIRNIERRLIASGLNDNPSGAHFIKTDTTESTILIYYRASLRNIRALSARDRYDGFRYIKDQVCPDYDWEGFLTAPVNIMAVVLSSEGEELGGAVCYAP